LTAAGRGDSARRLELLLVVARWRTVGFMAGGVTISKCSSSDFSLPSCTRVGGVLRGGDKLMALERVWVVVFLSHMLGVSGVTVSSDASRE